MNFREFTDWSAERPVCSTRRNGALGFNRAAVQRLGLHEGYVRVYFEEQARVIGIAYVGTVKESGTQKLVARQNNVFIPMRNLFERYGIDYASDTRSYEPRWSDEHKMILVDLSKPLVRGRAKRKEQTTTQQPVIDEPTNVATHSEEV
jgi:hypothetical protein